MHTNAHVDVDVSRPSQNANIADHSNAQINAVLRVSLVFYRQAGNAIVTIAQELYTQHIMLLQKINILLITYRDNSTRQLTAEASSNFTNSSCSVSTNVRTGNCVVICV